MACYSYLIPSSPQLRQIDCERDDSSTMRAKTVAKLLKSAASNWNDHQAPRLGAALAYYMLLSIAPLMIFVVSVSGMVFNRTRAEEGLLARIQQVTGYSGAHTVHMLLEDARRPGTGALATCIAFLTLLFGASGVFIELRESLNIVWDAPQRHSSLWREMVSERLTSFLMVSGFALLLLASLLVSAMFTVMAKFFSAYIPVHAAVLGEAANFLISFVAVAILFALIFKFVPDVPIAWRDVTIGAIATAFLFTIGKSLLALYIATAGIGSTYGAAGSLVALVVWVYYSAQIFFFGAEFTRAYADAVGSHSGDRPRLWPKLGRAAVK